MRKISTDEQLVELSRGHKAFASAAIVVVVCHIFAMYLWITPSNPLKDSVREPLRGYALPLFQQSWSIFAPNPVSSGYYLEVRAVDQSLEPREWVSASAVEIDGLYHNFLPPTASSVTSKLSLTAHDSYRSLSELEKEIFSWNYHVNTSQRLTSLAEERVGKVSSQFEKMVVLDTSLTAYATQFLKAKDRFIEDGYVQYRITKVTAPDFNERHERTNSEDVSFSSGRRAPVILYNQDEPGFARALEAF
ncbi:DUF5819 family protein [Populibacterium corticicola]|uniref:DUF5819 family protein n=1 Tax=Populibacterium corticicola TaxID=1812826 RepID=A0ABW5XIQ5_9MICO